MTVLYCRVEIDKDHTWSQVIVGGIIGSMVGLFTVLYIIPSEYVDTYMSNLNYKHYLRVIGQKPEVITMGVGLIVLHSGQALIEIENTLEEEIDDEAADKAKDYEDWLGVSILWGFLSGCDGEQVFLENVDDDSNRGDDPTLRRSLLSTPKGRMKHVEDDFSRNTSKRRYQKKKSVKQMLEEAHAGWCNDITNILFCCCCCKPQSFVEGIITDDEDEDEDER